MHIAHLREGNIYNGNGTTFMPFPVAEAKLVLVESTKKDGEIYHDEEGWHINHGAFNSGKYYKPILISETEKIEVGDWTYHSRKDMQQLKQVTNPNAENDLLNLGWRKVLALPEHFSPKHLQAIVDGKMKDGDKVLVECEKQYHDGDQWHHKIKLNSSNHITLHKVEEKMYSREELRLIVSRAIDAGKMHEYGQFIRSNDEWFEQNIK